MNRLLLSSLLLLIGSCQAPPQQGLSETEKSLLDSAIVKLNDAFALGDTATLSQLVTEDYLHTNSFYKAINKKTWMEYLAYRKSQIDSGFVEVLNYSFEEVEKRFNGQTAIVTGKIQANIKIGERVDTLAYRVTNFWVRQEGGWKRAAFHDGKIE
ncbi:MAG: nuclear transport factor 2 family protein [Bacteroidota bacterium]